MIISHQSNVSQNHNGISLHTHSRGYIFLKKKRKKQKTIASVDKDAEKLQS